MGKIRWKQRYNPTTHDVVFVGKGAGITVFFGPFAFFFLCYSCSRLYLGACVDGAGSVCGRQYLSCCDTFFFFAK